MEEDEILDWENDGWVKRKRKPGEKTIWISLGQPGMDWAQTYEEATKNATPQEKIELARIFEKVRRKVKREMANTCIICGDKIT